MMRQNHSQQDSELPVPQELFFLITSLVESKRYHLPVPRREEQEMISHALIREIMLFWVVLIIP